MTRRVHEHWPRIFACPYVQSSHAVCTSCSAVCFSHFWLLDPVQDLITSSLPCVLQSVWKQQLLDCRKQTVTCINFFFLLLCTSSHLQMCCRSAFLSCRLPEEVWRGLWLVSSGYFQLPDGGQLSGPAYPSSMNEIWNLTFLKWVFGIETDFIPKQWKYTRSEFL